MVYMLFSIGFALSIIGCVGTGLLHADDPRLGLLLIGNLCFIDIQLFFGGGFSGDAPKSALMLTLLIILETVRKYRNQ
jgi:hypothetical protein